MTSLDPSHLPTPGHKYTRGQAVYRRPGSSIVIPDLRFEQSYLRSVRRFIHDPPEHVAFNEAAGLPSWTEPVAPVCYGVPLKIDWGWILYVTTRDQILSPLAQGAIWAIASLYLRPFLRGFGARVRKHLWQSWQTIFPPFEPHVQEGAGWMRKQLREFTVGGVGTNIALAK